MIMIITKNKPRKKVKEQIQPDINKMTPLERQKYFDELAETDSSCVVKKHEEKYR